MNNLFVEFSENSIFVPAKKGAIAQLVEQRTENPCVPSSILGGTTEKQVLLEVNA